MSTHVVNLVFDGPPGHVGPRFIEAEDEQGHSIRVGSWVQRPDGYWVLRISVVVEDQS